MAASEPAPRQEDVTPMPFDLWWSPSLKRLLSRHENEDDEHLVWVMQGGAESLRHYLGTGLESNPPLPDDAVRLVQTTELERLRAQLAEATEVNQEWQRYKRRKIEERRKLESERDEARGQRNEAMETAGQLRDEVHQHQVAAANLYGRVFVALGLSITEPWAGLAEAAAKVRAERDERQARIEDALKVLDEPAPHLPRTDPHFERMNARDARTQLVQRVRAALAGDQPTAKRADDAAGDLPPTPFIPADQAFPEEP